MGTELFLNLLFHDKPDSDYILIWEKDERKLSYWFKKTSEAIKHITTRQAKCDTYVGCGTSAKTYTSFRRCKADEISGIPAAWIDVDILDPVHSKPNLPESPQKALEVIEVFPLKPTIVVHSGHGYQFWWVFKKFGKINDARDREVAADLLHLFTWRMRDRARSMGYDLDMTFDLSRVFRVPGTKNRKDNPPLQVVMEQCNQHLTYDVKEFKEAVNQFTERLGADATPVGERKKISITANDIVTGETFKLDPNAEPPRDKHEALMEFEPKYAASYEHRRKDFKSGDESASAYDLSLASFATANGWEPQEIVNMLIAFRRVNNLPIKLVESYYNRTLKAASNAIEHREAIENLGVINSEGLLIDDPDKTPEENAKRKAESTEKAKDYIFKIIKIKILGVSKYMVDPPEYKLETEKYCIHLGGIQNLIDQTYFRRKLADATATVMRQLKGVEWNEVAQALLNMHVEVSAGLDTSGKGKVKDWLRNYLAHYTPLYDKNEGLLSERPFYHHDSLYIYGPAFRQYIARHRNELITSISMGIMLREYGFSSLQMNVPIKQKYSSRTAWKIEVAKDKIAAEFCDMEMLHQANKIELENMTHKETADETVEVTVQ